MIVAKIPMVFTIQFFPLTNTENAWSIASIYTNKQIPNTEKTRNNIFYFYLLLLFLGYFFMLNPAR